MKKMDERCVIRDYSDLKNDDKSGIGFLNITNGLRTYLKKNGINTIQELKIKYDLGLLPVSNNNNHRAEIERVCEELNEAENLTKETFVLDSYQVNDASNLDLMSIGLLWKEISKTQRDFSILVNYYNNHENITLRLLGEHYGLTRERVRQIIENGTNKLRGLAGCDFVDKDLLSKVQFAADNQTEVNSLKIEDDFFISSGIAYLFATMYPVRYGIIKGRLLNSAFFVNTEFDIENRLKWLMDDLKYGFEPYSFEMIEQRYHIGKRVILSLNDIFERDGYVTSRGNYDVINKMLSKERNKTSDYKNNNMEKKHRSESELGLFIKRHIGKKIEFRYENARKNNNYEWRCAFVLGQDEWYMHTRLLSGKHVNYNKTRIIDYREL